MTQPQSCGHRSCPKCHHHDASRWLDRQRAKLLPIDYFMVTFTLPRELRALAWRHQTRVYTLLCDTATRTLKDFALNPRFLGADLAMTAVLARRERPQFKCPACHAPMQILAFIKPAWRSG